MCVRKGEIKIKKELKKKKKKREELLYIYNIYIYITSIIYIIQYLPLSHSLVVVVSLECARGGHREERITCSGGG